jgi:hypothetical protein
MTMLARKQTLRYGLESTYGTYASPTAALPIRGNPTISPWKGNQIDRSDLVRPYWDSLPSYPVAGYRTVEFTVDLSGSGTAGTAPPWGDLMLSAAASENILAAPVTGTCQSGSTSTTVKLAAGASAIDDYYAGMAISTTGGTGSGQTRVITRYNGTTKVATVQKAWTTTPDGTTTYSIAATVGYYPVSSVAAANTSLTLEWDMGQDGSTTSTRYILVGARGNASLDFMSSGVPVLKFSYTGLLYTNTDSTLPTVDFSAWQQPVEVNTSNSGDYLSVHGYTSAVMKSLSLDFGNQVEFHNLVNDQSVIITGRNPTGQIVVTSTTLAQKDWEAAVRTGATGQLCLRQGTTAGNIITLTGPAMQLTDVSFAEEQGIIHATLQCSLRAYSSAGNDSWRLFSG